MHMHENWKAIMFCWDSFLFRTQPSEVIKLCYMFGSLEASYIWKGTFEILYGYLQRTWDHKTDYFLEWLYDESRPFHCHATTLDKMFSC